MKGRLANQNSLSPGSAPKDGTGLLGFLGDLLSETGYNTGQKLKRQAERFIRDDSGKIVGIKPLTPGSQEEKDAFDNASGFLGTFAGIGAKTADLIKLKLAKSMEDKGLSRDAIWDKTGWFRSPDGKWRFEIGDNRASADFSSIVKGQIAKKEAELNAYEDAGIIRSFMDKYKEKPEEAIARFKSVFQRDPSGAADLLAETYTAENLSKMVAQGERELKKKTYPSKLGEVMQHDKLYEAYPELKKLKTTATDLEPFVYGQYSPRGGVEIANVVRNNPKSTILHEVQHAIQRIEGWAAGGAPTKATPEVVKNLAENIKTTQEALAEAKRFKYPEREVFQLEKELRQQKEELAFLRASLRNQGEAYLRLAGEAEARATQARALMSAEDRKAIPPWESYDREWADLIVRHDPKGKSAPNENSKGKR